MKFLKEAFGESEELNTFVVQAQRRFSEYYIVTLKLNGKIQENRFAFEEAARKAYKELLTEAKKNLEYYDGAEISWDKVTVNLDYDEQDHEFIFNDNEDDSDINMED